MISGLKSHLREWRPRPWMTRMLPGNSSAFGPPRRQEWADRVKNPKLKIAKLDIQRVQLASPVWLSAPADCWKGLPLQEPLPPPLIIAAENARLLAPDGTLVLNDDTWVLDCGFFPWENVSEAFRHHVLAKRKKSPGKRRLRGRTLSLAGDYTGYSYGHWLLDSITRWGLVEASGLGEKDFDQVYLPCPSPVARRIAAQLPFPADKLLLEPATLDWECDHVVATSQPGWAGYAPAYASKVLRSLTAANEVVAYPRRRIAILRDGFRRNFSNPEEIYGLLRARGFDLLDPRIAKDIPERCAQAEVIVTLEGSQAYDLLFARPDTPVLFVVSPHHVTFPYPQSAAGSAGLKLFLFAGSKGLNQQAKAESDFYVPIEPFSAALDIVLSNIPTLPRHAA